MKVISAKPEFYVPVLDIFSLGEKVNLLTVSQYIPISVFKIFEKALASIEGKSVTLLTEIERELVKMIISMSNEYLFVEVLWGKFQKFPKSQRLQTASNRYQQRIEAKRSIDLQGDRDNAREARRIRFCELDRISVMCLKASV